MNPLQEERLAGRNLSDQKSPCTVTIRAGTATDKLFEVSPVLRNDNFNSKTFQNATAQSPLLQHAHKKQKQFTHSPITHDGEKNHQPPRKSAEIKESLSTIASR